MRGDAGGLTMPDGTKPGGLFTVIFRKLPEGWKIVHDHTSAEETESGRSRESPRKGSRLGSSQPRGHGWNSLQPVLSAGGLGGAGRTIAARTRPPSSHPPISSIAAPIT